LPDFRFVFQLANVGKRLASKPGIGRLSHWPGQENQAGPALVDILALGKRSQQILPHENEGAKQAKDPAVDDML
jgi:hypothetical protein